MWANLTRRICDSVLMPHLSRHVCALSDSGPIAMISAIDAPWFAWIACLSVSRCGVARRKAIKGLPCCKILSIRLEESSQPVIDLLLNVKSLLISDIAAILLVPERVPQTPRPTYIQAGPRLRIYTGETDVDHARGMH
jgi:hypothetical protein